MRVILARNYTGSKVISHNNNIHGGEPGDNIMCACRYVSVSSILVRVTYIQGVKRPGNWGNMNSVQQECR